MKLLAEHLPKHIIYRPKLESPIEVTLFNAMMRRDKFTLCQEHDTPQGEGYFVFPQMPVGSYRADFIIRALGYAKGVRVWPPRLHATLAVECDGQEFHSTPEQIEYDKKRDAYFQENGIKTIRIKGTDIHHDARYCVDLIEHALQMAMKPIEGGKDEVS